MKKENSLAAFVSIVLYIFGFTITGLTLFKMLTPEGGTLPFLLVPSLVGGCSLIAFGVILHLLSRIEMHLRPEEEIEEEEETKEED